MQAFTGWELYCNEAREPLLKVGDAVIDGILNGGLRKGITEISGEAGSGKSSLGMQLLFQCCLPTNDGGLNGKAVYLSTEGRPNEARYTQLLKHYSAQYKDIDFGSNILMLDVNKLVFQEQSLFKLLPQEAELNNVKLVVLDCISTFYRLKTNFIYRAKEMNKTRQHLSKLSYRHNMVVVLINQVSDVFDDEYQHQLIGIHTHNISSSDRKIKPTLGLAWSNGINTRIMLSRKTAVYEVGKYDMQQNEAYCQSTKSKIVRQLHVIFSPYIDKKFVHFKIDDRGVTGMTEEQLKQYINCNKSTETKKEPPKQDSMHEIFQGMDSKELQDIFKDTPGLG